MHPAIPLALAQPTQILNPMDDLTWLRAAIQLAQQCPPSLSAYSVGAIIVGSDGRQLAAGFSRESDPAEHAEEAALAKLSGQPNLGRATLFSTLEPCSQRASRPLSCTQHILRSGLGRVVFAWSEPSLFVADCTGAQQLRDAGVQVLELAELASEAQQANSHLPLKG